MKRRLPFLKINATILFVAGCWLSAVGLLVAFPHHDPTVTATIEESEVLPPMPGDLTPPGALGAPAAILPPKDYKSRKDMPAARSHLQKSCWPYSADALVAGFHLDPTDLPLVESWEVNEVARTWELRVFEGYESMAYSIQRVQTSDDNGLASIQVYWHPTPAEAHESMVMDTVHRRMKGSNPRIDYDAMQSWTWWIYDPQAACGDACILTTGDPHGVPSDRLLAPAVKFVRYNMVVTVSVGFRAGGPKLPLGFTALDLARQIDTLICARPIVTAAMLEAYKPTISDFSALRTTIYTTDNVNSHNIPNFSQNPDNRTRLSLVGTCPSGFDVQNVVRSGSHAEFEVSLREYHGSPMPWARGRIPGTYTVHGWVLSRNMLFVHDTLDITVAER